MFICEPHHEEWNKDTGCPYCREDKLEAASWKAEGVVRELLQANDKLQAALAVYRKYVDLDVSYISQADQDALDAIKEGEEYQPQVKEMDGNG